jgi:hypothetical protein
MFKISKFGQEKSNWKLAAETFHPPFASLSMGCKINRPMSPEKSSPN